MPSAYEIRKRFNSIVTYCETHHDTTFGNRGVRTQYVTANQNVANSIPTNAPQNTCDIV